RQITQLTGITDQMVARAPKFFEVAKKIVQMTEGKIFVAHNASFDYSFVREEFQRLGYDFQRRQLCTVRLARKVFPGLPSYSLSNLKKHFQIHADKSHRALDDTLATTRLFELILAEQDGRGQIRTLVNHGVKETKLPSAITLDKLHDVPEQCGVYYFHNANGDVIYVGKSLNIRKRLFEHFADQTPKGEKLRAGVADISWEVTGSELVALLNESAEIKRLLPPVNRAQRNRQYTGAIYAYSDLNGYRCLIFGKNTAKNAKNLELIAEFPKPDNARNQLQALVYQHELCHRLTHLDTSEQACFHFKIKKCHGACVGDEPAESYNERVEAAIQQISRKLVGNFFFVEKARSETEVAIIGVKDGRYLGYCFIDTEQGDQPVSHLLESLKQTFSDPDARRIILNYVEKRPKGIRRWD
ncbi:MAG TPA: DNA polymerase III subunit epsilon, partial [Saprospirales bacterium]|nr:DNA polymerase III subunit epsilon [Saprospirales bacterium]